MDARSAVLLIDRGNTRLKWRLAGAAGTPARDGVAALEEEPFASAGELARVCRAQPPGSAWIANVAGEAALRDIVEALTRAGVPHRSIHVVVSQAQALGLVNGYRDPAQLGVDRWVQAIGIHRRNPGLNVVVASLGTAATIDFISAAGRFEGGVILPGWQTMRRSLARETAQLPEVDGHYSCLADNTADAIESGIVHALCGAIERVVHGLSTRQPRGGPVRLVLAGGDAHRIAAALPLQSIIVDNPVLDGLSDLAGLANAP